MSFSILYFSRAWSLNGVYRVSEVGKVRVSVRYRACAKHEVVAEYVFTNIRNTKIENHLSKCEVGKYLSYMKWTVLIRNEVFQLVHETSAQYKHSVEARCLASVELIDSNPWSALEITSKLHRRKKIDPWLFGLVALPKPTIFASLLWHRLACLLLVKCVERKDNNIPDSRWSFLTRSSSMDYSCTNCRLHLRNPCVAYWRFDFVGSSEAGPEGLGQNQTLTQVIVEWFKIHQ